MFKRLAMSGVEKVLMGLVWVIFAPLGFVIGVISCLPMLSVAAVSSVTWLVDILSHTGLSAHERLHRVSASAVGAPVTSEGWRSVPGSDHDAYSVQADLSSVSQALLVAYAPLTLSFVAVVSFSVALVVDSFLVLVLLSPFILASVRYSLPSDSDALVVLRHVRSDPFNPLNFVALPVSLLFVLLGSPRRLHYRLLHVSELLWGSLLFVVSSRLLDLLLTHYPYGLHETLSLTALLSI